MESTFSTTLLITNRLHVSLTDGHAEIQTGHTLGFIPEVIHNGTTVKMRVISRDAKHGSSGRVVYKAKIHNDETTIWFDFKCDDKLKNTARIVSPHPDLFDAKITPFSESDHPLYVEYVVGPAGLI